MSSLIKTIQTKTNTMKISSEKGKELPNLKIK